MSFFRQSDGIWETYDYGTSSKTERFCDDFVVQGILTDAWENEQFLVLAYMNNIGEWNRISFRRDEIISEGLKAMKKNGFGINPEREKFFAGAVQSFEASAVIMPIHQKLGMFNENGQLYFLGYKSIGCASESQYYGSLDIVPTGDLDVWLQMFREDVVPYPKMLFGFAVAFSSPIVAVLKKKIENQALLVALCGSSGGGKSSTLKGGISIYGAPTAEGLLGDFNNTDAYNVECMADSNGYLTALDEAVTQKSLDEFCYFGSNAISKGRVKPDGKRRERKRWAGTIMISCEGSALALTSGNTGAAIRLIEVATEFTQSGEHAERIQEICNENYGLAVLPYAKFLIDKGLAEMEQDYEQCKKELKQYIQKHKKTLASTHDFGRVLNRMTFILQAARYAVICFDVAEYNEAPFLDFLTTVIASVLGYVEEKKEDLMDIVKDYVVTHQNNFVLMHNGKKNQPHVPEGQIFVYKNRTELKITKVCFDRLMRGQGKDPMKAAQQFKADGRIVTCHKERNTCTVTLIKGVKQAAYHLLLEKNPVGKVNALTQAESEGLDGVDTVTEMLIQQYLQAAEAKKAEIEKRKKVESDRRSLLEDDTDDE